MNATALSLFFVTATLLLRLPHLLGTHVALDGDEAIVSLMGRDLMNGSGIPIFFYGQRYELAFFEAAPLAAAFRVFGEAPIVVKTTMLAIWTVGGLFALRAADRLAGSRAALVTGLVLSTLPAWIGWSMKARGGYVSAFAASQISLWLLARFRKPRRGEAEGGALGPAFALGVCLAIGFFAQPLFMLPVLPFLWFLRPVRAWAWLLAGLGGVGLPLASISRELSTVWEPQLFGAMEIASLLALPARLATALSGVYYDTEAGQPPDVVFVAGWVFAAALLLLVGYALLSRLRDEWTDVLRATALGVIGTIFAVLWIRPEAFGFRYLLPTAAPLAHLLGTAAARFAARSELRRSIPVALGALCSIGIAAAWAHRNVSLAVVPGADVEGEAAATAALIEHLHERGIASVFVTDPTYQWNLIFESRGTIDARWIHSRDRLPEISLAVDRAFRSGRPVALIGDARFAAPLRGALQRSGLAAFRLDVVAGRHFVLEAPPEALLRRMGFELDSAAGP